MQITSNEKAVRAYQHEWFKQLGWRDPAKAIEG